MIDKQLKAMMDKKGLTLEKLSVLSNVPVETIRNIIYRRARNPRVDTVLALSRTLNVSMECLMGESLCEEEEQLLFTYRESGEHGKKFIRAIAEIEAQWQEGLESNGSKYAIPCLIPSAQTADGAIFSSFDVEHIETACQNVYMAIRMPNDHFSPRYCKNDILLLSDKFPTEGENALFLYDHRLYFRQFHIMEKGYALNTINGRGVPLHFRRMDSCRLIGTCMAVQ